MFSKTYFDEVISISKKIDHQKVENLVDVEIFEKIRTVIYCWCWRSASNASHMANDLKIMKLKLASISDNISNLLPVQMMRVGKQFFQVGWQMQILVK